MRRLSHFLVMAPFTHLLSAFFCAYAACPDTSTSLSLNIPWRVAAILRGGGPSSASALDSTAAPSLSTATPASHNCTTAHNATTAPLPTTTSSAHTNVSTTASVPTNVSTASVPAVTAMLSPDLAILAPRRIDFIVTQQMSPVGIPDWLATMGVDGKWPDAEIDYTTGCPARRANWPAQVHWQRLGALAAAWHGYPGADPTYVNNPSVRAKIALGMDWWFARDFTVDGCLDNGGTTACPCGTPGLWNTNWFSNVILIPRFVGQTCLLLNATLTPSQSSNCTHMTARTYTTFMRTEPPGWLVGANLLDIASIGIASGLLTGNDPLVTDAYTRVHNEVRVKTGIMIDGILTDGSFGQHAGLMYNGNYGKDYSNDVLELEIEAGGTKFAAVGAPKMAFESLMDGSQWMIYENTATGVLHWDFSAVGRFISFPVIDDQATANIKINLTEVTQLGTLWGSSVLQDVYNGLTTSTSTANIGNLLGNRVFWNSDYMVTRGSNYVSTVKMYSSRTRNSECVNLGNTVGFHLADGATYTYVQGNEYEDISAAWDWNLIPGTTVDYGGTALSCDTENHIGVEKFVGGVSTGTMGAAAMRFTNPITKHFSFQKAWFHFANDVQHVMVSILASNSTAPVFSVLDQRTHSGPIYVNGAPVTGGNFSTPSTLFHADTGYKFVTAPKLSISAGLRTGAWTAIGTSTQPPVTVDMFAAWIAHGTALAPVAYTVFPGRTLTEFEQEAGQNPVTTVRADTSVSAVQDHPHGTTMIAFWQPAGGTVVAPGLTVTVSNACVVIMDEPSWTVTVADPTQLLKSVLLTFDIPARAHRPPSWRHHSVKSINITLPAAPLAGSSVSRSLL